MKKIIIESKEQTKEHILSIYESIDYTLDIIRSNENNKELFFDMKFNQIGKDPLFQSPMNVIEQLNQTYTYLVSLKAAEFIYEHLHYEGSIVLNLGTVSGHDIETIDGKLIGEVFSATSVNSNQKLKKDIEKLISTEKSGEKYVFFFTPEYESNIVENYKKRYPSINIIRIEV